jgi:hypothetical protein
MKRWMRLTLLAAAITQGCATTVWVHPEKDVRGFYRDSTECQALATTAGGVFDTYGLVAARVYPQCMVGRGWTPEQRS